MSRGEHKMMRKDQRGFTIVELLIAVAILAIVIAAVCGFILVGSRSYASANSDISVQQEAQLALNQMSDVLIDTTRSVNYAGYDSSGSAVLALKDSEFGFEPVAKSLIMYNGVPVQKNPATPGADPDIKIEKGNGNKHYHFYWDKDDETLYYAELEVKETDKKPEDVHFPAFGDPADPSDPASSAWVVLAEHVTKFEVDLTQVEEKRVVQLELTFTNGKREYNTSNNVTIRNKVAVNDAEIGPLNRKKTLSIAVRDKGVIIEPGESYHFSMPKVTGENVTDKSVTWSIVSANSPSGGTQFTDAANGILKIAPDEPAGTIQVMVTTNAVDSDGNHASTPPIDVHIKRVTTLGLYKSADTNDENGPNEISPGCTFTISTNVDGPRLGETCSACGESTEKDRHVSCEGNKYNSNFPWRIVDPQEYDPSMAWWKPKDYLKLISQDEHSATFYLEPNTPDDGSFKFVIQAMSLLSVCPNEQGRCQYYFGEAIELTSVKGKSNAKPFSGNLKYGEETLLEEIRAGLPTDHPKYVTAVRVVDNSGKEPDKVLLYFTTGGGNNYRIGPDLFDLDLNGSYTFYMQAIDPVSKENRDKYNNHEVGSVIEDDAAAIKEEYFAHLDKNKPYGYIGTKYPHNEVYYSVLDKPKLTFMYKNVSYKGEHITYDPVNIYSVGNGSGIVGEIRPIGYENIVQDNSVWNNYTNSLYEGEGSDITNWNKIYYFNKETMSYEGTNQFAGKVTVDPKGSMFMKLEYQGDILGACGKYHIVPGMLYQNLDSGHFEIIGWDGFDYPNLPREKRYYQFDDSIIHVEVNSEFTMEIKDDWFTGKVLFPLPSQMAGDVRFPNLQNIEWQTSNGSFTLLVMPEGWSNAENREIFSYVRYRYISKQHTYEVEPFEVRYDIQNKKMLTHSYGIYVCEEDGKEWVHRPGTGGTVEKELIFTVKDFEYDNGSYQTYFPLPTENGFPFVNGIEQTSCSVSLYDNNLQNKANLSGVTVTCKQTGDNYEIKFARKVKDQNQDNHKITIIPCGTYTWSPGKTEWRKTGKDNIEYDTDLKVNLENLKGKWGGNGKLYKLYFPLPTEGAFPFSGTQGVQKDYKPVAYKMSDQYGESPEKNMSYTVEYKKTGDTYQIEFVDRQGPNGDNHKITIKSYGAYTWQQGDKEWTKITSQDRFECDLDVNLEGLVLNGQSCKMRFPLPYENDFKSMFSAPGAEIENSGPAIYLEGDTYCENRKWNYDFGGNIKIKYELVGTDEHRITFFYDGWSNNVHTSSTFKCKDGDTEWTEVP